MKGKNSKDGLYLRGNVWWMNFTVNGRHYQKSTGTTDYKTAIKVLEALKARIILNHWIPEQNDQKQTCITFKELAERYAEYCKGRQKGFEKFKKYVIAMLVKRFGSFELTDFNTYTIEQFQTEFLQKGKKPASINRYMGVLGNMFTKANEWGLISEDVLKQIRKIKPLKGVKNRLRFLSKEEAQSLLNACDKHIYPIVTVALNTGMRKGEILNLKWDQVDLKHGFILLGNETKNGERREIPLNNTLKELFIHLFTKRRLDTEYVFVNPETGKRFVDIKKSWSTACRKAGIKDFHFHDLRHTFASQLVMNGVDLTTVKELLGHKDIKMTLRYSHLAPEHKQDAVKKLDNFLGQNTPKIAQKST